MDAHLNQHIADFSTASLKAVVERRALILFDENDAFIRFTRGLNRFLISGADPNVQCDSTGNTFVHNIFLYTNNDSDKYKLLLLFRLFTRSPRFNQYTVNHHGDAIIHKAVKVHSLDFLQLYLQTGGIDVNVQDRGKNTALQIACNTELTIMGDSTPVQKIKLLLDTGANPNIANGQNFTPIFDVCHYLESYVRCNVDPLPAIQFLLDAKADPNITPTLDIFEKRSCLHQLATEYDCPVSGQICTMLLMRSEAKLNAVDRNGCTPLDIAKRCGNTFVIDAINTFNERMFSVGAMDHKRLAGGPSRLLSDDVMRKILDLSLAAP